MFCKNCGKNNADGSIFCENCGSKLVDAGFIQNMQANGAAPINMVLADSKDDNTNNYAARPQTRLIECPVCGKKISSIAEKCPECGNITAYGESESERKRATANGFLSGIYWLLSCAMFLKALYYWMSIERHSALRYYNNGDGYKLILSVMMMIIIVVIDAIVCFATSKGKK